MIPGARLVLLGRQGAGKGTQCVRLSRHYVVPHISTGDILRAAVREGTEYGLKAAECMRLGDLVPDDIIIGMVDERLEHDDTRTRGYIPGIRPGKPTETHLATILNRITLPGALFLAFIALLPALALHAANIDNFPFAGTTLLIAVGVALETMKQIDSQLMMRNYDGFLRK